MKIKEYLLEVIVFLCGAAIMIFEMAGSRVLAPFFGSSIFVWSSLIGVVLGSLSVGYGLGGKLADRNAKLQTLSKIIFFSAVFIGLVAFFKNDILFFVQKLNLGLKNAAVLSCFLLFSFPSIFLGMVSPYAVKLKLKSLNRSGSDVGKLYAISTLGSIGGTFLAGFYLIPSLGVTNILFALACLLIFSSLLVWHEKGKIVNVLLIVFFLFLMNRNAKLHEVGSLVEIETVYNSIQIYDSFDKRSKSEVRNMKINNNKSSSMFLHSDELVYDYLKFYRLLEHFHHEFEKVLMIGGAGYSYPKFFLNSYPEASIDVVEVDPGVTLAAKRYFNLKEDPRMSIFHSDGRMFLEKSEKKYDAVLIDAFTSFSIPFHLTTLEYVQELFDSLDDKGLVMLNIVSSIEGERGKFLRAEYFTYKKVFPQVLIFPVQFPKEPDAIQNLVMIALKDSKNISEQNISAELQEFYENLWREDLTPDVPIITDDFAPVEYYANEMIDGYL